MYTLNQKEMNSLFRLLEYDEKPERKDWYSEGCPDDHIYKNIQVLMKIFDGFYYDETTKNVLRIGTDPNSVKQKTIEDFV